MLARALLALSLTAAFPAWSAPLFDRTTGSPSATLSDEARSALVVLNRDTLRAAKAGSQIEIALPGVVLVLYTPEFATDKGGSAGVNLAIDNLLAVSNQACKDSGVSIQLRRVGAEQVNVADKTSNSTVLNDLTNGVGAFSNVKARRTALGADLVTLVRPFWMQSQASCGVGWIGGYNLAPISNYANHAYSVVSEGSDRAKTGYYCHVTSFVHELGQNMGLMHDRANAGTLGRGKTNPRDNQASVAPAKAGAQSVQKACCVAL